MTESTAALSHAASPRTTRLLGATAVALQVGILWIVTKDSGIGVALAVLLWTAAIGLRLPGSRWLRKSPAYVALAAIMLLKLNFLPYDISEFVTYLGTNLAYEVATYLILAQIAMLFGFVDRGLPAIFSAAGGLCIFLLSDIQTGRQGHLLMLGAVLAHVILSIAQYRLGRRAVRDESIGWLPIAASGLIALSLGCGVALGLAKYNRVIERSLMTVMGMSAARASAGFSTTGDLTTASEWRAADDGRVALRVVSDSPPGYLKGQALIRYTGIRWRNPSESLRPVGPVEHPDRLPESDLDGRVFATEGHSTFRTENESSDENAEEPDVPAEVLSSVMTVWPEAGQDAFYFHPPAPAFIKAPTPSLQLDGHGNAVVEEDLTGQPYTTYSVNAIDGRQEFSVSLRPSQRAYYLSYPEAETSQLVPVLGDVLEKIFGPGGYEGVSTREKAARVEAYFRENYRYRLGMKSAPPPRRDKTEWFLSERREGHCEFFASSTCLLLRAAGVPTRYAVGFVVREQNAVGGYWVARNRDAHAWCEAYDDETKRWFVVESTPAAGVPGDDRATGWGGFADAARLAVKQWQAAWQRRDLKADIAAASSQLNSPSIFLLVGFMAGSAAVWLKLQQKRSESRPELRPLTDLMARFDRFAARQGLARQPDETLRQFAARADAAGKPWASAADEWLRTYSGSRYRTASRDVGPSDDELASLKAGLSELRSAASR